jgi:hypothetical protein
MDEVWREEVVPRSPAARLEASAPTSTRGARCRIPVQHEVGHLSALACVRIRFGYATLRRRSIFPGATMRTLALLAAAAAALLLSACASSTVTKTGTASYAPLSPTADVAIFTAESRVGKAFELVANISYTDPGKYAVSTLSNSFEPLKATAREVAANGVIIDTSSQVISGITSRGISVDARAIRLSTPLTTAGASAATPAGAAKDDAEAFRQLKKLHQDGMIADREYEQKMTEILRRM